MSPPPDTAPADPSTRATLEAAGALDAWRFAAERHEGQLRPVPLAPFIQHPERVAVLVAEAGGTSAMVAAALLHDVLEETPIEAAEIDRRFGGEVGGMVRALSDDPEIADYERRKEALCAKVREAGADVALIYAADKLANASDLRDVIAEVGMAADARLKAPFDAKMRIWRNDLAMCREVLGEVEVVERLGQELNALEREHETLGPTESII